MSLLEKKRCYKFYKFIQDYDVDKIETHKKKNLKAMTFGDLVKDFGLNE